MKKCIGIILTISLVVLAGNMSEGVVKNLFDNAGFEEGESGWELSKPWSIVDSGGRNNTRCAYVDYQGEMMNKAISLMSNEVMINPDKYYRLSVWTCSTIRDPKYPLRSVMLIACGIPGGDPIYKYTNFMIYPFWNRVSHYFYSKTFTTMKSRFFIGGVDETKAWVDDTELVELTDKELKENLIENPDFEEGEDGYLPAGWIDSLSHLREKRPPLKLTLDSNAEFVRGTKSIKMDGTAVKNGQNVGGIESYSIPAVAGKDYVYSVWIKARDEETTVQLWVSSQFVGPTGHWWKGQDIKVTTEWRKYSFDVHVPGPDEERYEPGKLFCATITLKDSGIIWVDEVKLMQK